MRNLTNDHSRSFQTFPLAYNVYVFRTNVCSKEHARKIVEMLKSLNKDLTVSFDLEDCDKILRVENPGISASEVSDIVNRYGFECEALNDG